MPPQRTEPPPSDQSLSLLGDVFPPPLARALILLCPPPTLLPHLPAPSVPASAFRLQHFHLLPFPGQTLLASSPIPPFRSVLSFSAWTRTSFHPDFPASLYFLTRSSLKGQTFLHPQASLSYLTSLPHTGSCLLPHPTGALILLPLLSTLSSDLTPLRHPHALSCLFT